MLNRLCRLSIRSDNFLDARASTSNMAEELLTLLQGVPYCARLEH